MPRIAKPRAVAPWIIDCAKLAGVDPVHLRDLYRSKGRLGPPPDRAMFMALQWLRASERDLEMRILTDVRYANATDDPVIIDGQKKPRYLSYHTFRSEHSRPGFPDEWVIDRRDHVLWVWENKAEDGTSTPDQNDWLVALHAIENTANSPRCMGIMKPSNWGQIGRVLVFNFEPDIPAASPVRPRANR